jgi:hypothetical protein
MADVLQFATLGTTIVVAFLAMLSKRQMKVIHTLVNARLDQALQRIQDLERTIKDSAKDRGSTAESLQSKKSVD